MGTLTLLTDFGLSDGYVGMMKGVIAGVNPQLAVIDLTHQIPPQNIALARFALMTAYPYFPDGTVHLAVVDPGVGSNRRAIAISVGSNPTQPRGFLVGPDNGLFSGVLSQNSFIAAVKLSNQQYWRTSNPSSTFHGRDIFAPVAAHLASGVPLEALGEAIEPETLVQLDIPSIQVEALNENTYRIRGCFQAADHFGNLITNIPGDQVLGKEWIVEIGNLAISGRKTYSDSSPGNLLALIGSHGWVEIAVNSGNAKAVLKLDLGEEVQVVVKGKER
jgi:S-adenosylmethionine hydrolase